MEEQTHYTKIGNRVRLKSDGQDALYSAAYAGSEGWVKEQVLDDLGYPKIYVEWDRDHWAYSGETDKWTFESHFDVIEGEDRVSDKSAEDFEKFQQWLAFQEAQKSPEGESSKGKEPEVEDKFAEHLTMASELLGRSKSFAVFVVTEETEDGSDPTLVPALVYANSGDSPAAKLLMDMQIGQVGSHLHKELSLTTIAALGGVEE